MRSTTEAVHALARHFLNERPGCRFSAFTFLNSLFPTAGLTKDRAYDSIVCVRNEGKVNGRVRPHGGLPPSRLNAELWRTRRVSDFLTGDNGDNRVPIPNRVSLLSRFPPVDSSRCGWWNAELTAKNTARPAATEGIDHGFRRRYAKAFGRRRPLARPPPGTRRRSGNLESAALCAMPPRAQNQAHKAACDIWGFRAQ